jgi:hypothetical protein
MQQARELGNEYKLLVAICERKDHLGDLRIDGLIMLIAILRK